MSIQEQIEQIVPGKNYPSTVKVKEEGHEITWRLQSYVVGMYCAIYFEGSNLPFQTGDHDNKGFVGKLKKDLQAAIKRGAEVTITGIQPVKV